MFIVEKSEIPISLATFELMQLVRACLKEDGNAVFNIIGRPFFDDAWSARINRTIQKAFSFCVVQLVRCYDGLTNMVYACSTRVVIANNKNPFYTDNFNRAGFDQNQAVFIHKNNKSSL